MATSSGSASFGILKVASVLTAVGAAILAIVVWASASEPQLGFDAFGEISITRESSGVKIATGFAIAVVGLVQAALLWAIASIGEHVIALRSQPLATASTAPPTRPVGSADASTTAPAVSSLPSGTVYEFRVTSAGKKPDKAVQMLEETFGLDRESAAVAARGETILTGSYATVEGARTWFTAWGGSADVRKIEQEA
jgi:hypothetical protein